MTMTSSMTFTMTAIIIMASNNCRPKENIIFFHPALGAHWESIRSAERPTQGGSLPNSTPLVSLFFLQIRRRVQRGVSSPTKNLSGFSCTHFLFPLVILLITNASICRLWGTYLSSSKYKYL